MKKTIDKTIHPSQIQQSQKIYKKLLYALLLSCLLPFPLKSTITVTAPPPLQKHFNNRKFEYSLANFGDVPYGYSISGSLVLANPRDACSQLTNNFSGSQTILVVERGRCHFAKKVLNAQMKGMKLVLIIDDKVEDIDNVFPVERGFHMLSLVTKVL